MQITDQLRVVIEAEVERAIRDMDKWDDVVGATEKKLDSLEKAADKISGRLMLVSGGFTAVGAAGLKFAADIETQKIALEVLTGSAETATKVFGELQSFAAKTPLSMDDINAAATQLLNFGTGVDEVTATLKTLGDVSMGNAGKLDTVVRAYGRMQMKGKATMEELNMLTEAGVPILDQLSKSMGVATDEIFKMAATGQVSFSDVEAAFAALTGEGGKFNNMLERQSASLSGKLSTSLDNLKISAAKLMETVVPMAKDLLDAISRAAEGFQRLDEKTKKTIITLMGIGIVAGPILKAALGVVSLTREIGALGSAVVKVAPLLLNPWTLLAVGIGAATIAVVGYIAKQREAIRESTKAFYSDPKKQFEQMAADWTQALSQYWEGKAKMDSASLDAYVKKFNDGMKAIGSTATITRQAVIQAIHDISVPDEFVDLVSTLKISDKELLGIEKPYKQLEVMILAAKRRVAEAAAPPETGKTWAKWFEEITEIDKELFASKDKDGNIRYSGQKAAELYLSGVGSELAYAEAIGVALGEKINPIPYLEKQKDKINEDLIKLLSAPKGAILKGDEFNFGLEVDESGNAKVDASIKALIDRYRELTGAISAADDERQKLAKSEELSKKAADMVKSIETPLERYQARLAEIDEIWKAQSHEGQLLNDAQLLKLTAAAADEYRAALAAIDREQEKTRSASFEEWIEALSAAWWKNAGASDDAAAAMARIGTQIAMVAITGLVDGFKELGEAWADGAISAEELGSALGNIAQKVLDMLPMLFVQAGLQLLGDASTRGLGIGLIFGGISAAIIAGLTGEATKNAKGNIFDSGSITPFAKGGAFTNKIVNRATRFNIGEMGEAGPEGIVPLERMSDGSLGVNTSGVSAPQAINFNVINYSGQRIQKRESSNGSVRDIEMIVGSLNEKLIAEGRYDKANGARYGQGRRAVRG